MIAGRLVEVHGIEGAHRLHLAGSQMEDVGHLGHALDRQEPVLVLHRPQARQDSTPGVRVAIPKNRDLLASPLR